MFAVGEGEANPKELSKFLKHAKSKSTMPRHQLLIANPKITLKRSKNGKTYFLILDQDTNLVYYAFPDFIKKENMN